MYSTSVYYYVQRQTVVLYIGSSPRRYQTVYAKNLKLHKGVDNLIQFQFLNQEQKPVDVTDKVITFRLLSYDGKTILLNKALSAVLPLTGIVQLELNSADIEDIDPQNGYYSLEIPVGSFDLPVFVDSEAGARGKISIVDSVLPGYVPSLQVTIPSHLTPDPLNPITFYSSPISTNDNPVITIQTEYANYSGSMQIQGSTTGSDWYNVTTATTFTSASETDYVNLTGYHPYLKLKFISTGGTVDKILAR